MKQLATYMFVSIALGVPGAAMAQAQDTMPPPPRPFVRGGVYDRPYLARLLGRTAVGGYAEFHARLQRPIFLPLAASRRR